MGETVSLKLKDKADGVIVRKKRSAASTSVKSADLTTKDKKANAPTKSPKATSNEASKATKAEAAKVEATQSKAEASEVARVKRLEEIAAANIQRQKDAKEAQKEAQATAKKQKQKGRNARPQAQAEPEEDARPVRNAKKPRDNSSNNNDDSPRQGKKSAGKNNKGARNNNSRYNDYGSYDDGEYGEENNRRGKNRRNKKSKLKQNFTKPSAPIVRDVVIGETITVAELANRMAVKAAEIVKFFFEQGEMVTINNVLSQDIAELVVEAMGHKAILRNDNDLEMAILNESAEQQNEAELEIRAPVVTIMGHVDHGKTSLLDYIRKAKVAAGEAGGITQHIGAYHVTLDSGRHITFLDTPGHAAFTNMRARGAKATDVVVLVVAADDGVMPQTIEAIEHARAAKVPMIVAINKIDKPEANPTKVTNELMQHGVYSEDVGGEDIFVEVSAKTGKNIDKLLETIALQAEVYEFKATRNAPATGVVIESCLDKGRGPVATVLVQNGTLHKGDIILCGLEYGKVRAMSNDRGQTVEEAGPSIPVEVLGLSGVPSAGDEVTVVADERKAREVANYRQTKSKELKIARMQKAKLENLFANLGDTKVDLNIVLKADVQGSVEALASSLTDLSNDEVNVNIISRGVGGITETDATLAVASSAIIIGFNVRADASARAIIERENVDLRYHDIIYEVIDEVKSAMLGMLEPEFKNVIIGLAEVRDVFRSPKFGNIAGCKVTEGVVKRNNPIRVLRNNIVIYEGKLESLRIMKDDVTEVRNGQECGIGVKNYNDVKVGDQIEVFERVEVERKL